MRIYILLVSLILRPSWDVKWEMSGVKRLSWRMRGLGMLYELLVVPCPTPVAKKVYCGGRGAGYALRTVR
jgi:hypothetical protein